MYYYMARFMLPLPVMPFIVAFTLYHAACRSGSLKLSVKSLPSSGMATPLFFASMWNVMLGLYVPSVKV